MYTQIEITGFCRIFATCKCKAL